jgi:hypothetical protein
VQTMGRVRKIFGWILWTLGVLFAAAKFVADWVGRTTLPDDASELARRMTPAVEFLQRQPDLWFYASQATLATVGLVLICWGRLHRVAAVNPAVEHADSKPALEWTSKEEHEQRTGVSLSSLFRTDFGHCLKYGGTMEYEYEGKKMGVRYHLAQDYDANSEYLMAYFPHSAMLPSLVVSFVDQIKDVLDTMRKEVRVESSTMGSGFSVSNRDLVFSGRFFVYHEDTLSLQEMAFLEKYMTDRGYKPIFRSQNYVTENVKNQKFQQSHS